MDCCNDIIISKQICYTHIPKRGCGDTCLSYCPCVMHGNIMWHIGLVGISTRVVLGHTIAGRWVGVTANQWIQRVRGKGDAIM
jgi:hypothetical protein